jgi:hypothetical protein
VIIDPANGNLPTTDLYYNAKTQVESQKLANKAGLYIQVNVSDPNNPLINIYGPPGSTTTSTPPGNIGPNGGIKLIPPTNMSDGSLTTVAGVTYYKLNTGKQAAEPTTGSGTPPLVTYLPFRVKNVVVTKSGSTYTTTTKILDAKGNPVALDSYTTAGTVTTAGSGTVGTTNTLYSNSTVTGSSYGYGMYDQRRGTTGGANLTNSTSFVAGLAAGDPGATDLVQIDMKALNAAVDSMAAGTSGVLDPKNSIKNLDGTIWGPPRGSNTSPDWNGGVYVEVKTSVSPTTTPYVPADYPAALANQTTSVRLVDGTVSSGSSLMPNYGDGGLGLTVATNAPVYILGNFNADGNASTGDATTPDDGHTGAAGSSYSESPVCVAGDAVTLLSKNWQDSASLKNNNTADDTEYATALLVGLVPTGNVNADSQYANSGGAHNLPRFLENWSGQTATLRGSLATLFNCKVAKQSWSTQYYSPPNRNWGFDQILKNGHYPPITPRVIDTKRILFTTLSQDAYNTIRHNMWPSEF